MLSETVPVPDCLKGRLEFGNREMINALKLIEKQMTEQEQRTKDIKQGVLKKFSVEVEYSGTEYLTVWATDEEEAKEIAKEESSGPDGWELEVYNVREVKAK